MMHLRIWTFRFPTPRKIDDLNEIILGSAESYLGVADLIRKYYAISPDGGEVRGMYLWENNEAADRFQNAEWVSMVERRWGVDVAREDYLVPCVVEAQQNRVIIGNVS